MECYTMFFHKEDFPYNYGKVAGSLYLLPGGMACISRRYLSGLPSSLTCISPSLFNVLTLIAWLGSRTGL